MYGVGFEPGEEPDCDWGAAVGADAWDEENILVEVKKTIDHVKENSGEKN